MLKNESNDESSDVMEGDKGDVMDEREKHGVQMRNSHVNQKNKSIFI